MRFVLNCMAALSGLASTQAFATVASGAVAARPLPVNPVSGGSVMQMLAGLILVIALIFFLAWALKRFTGLPGQHNSMRVVASLSLSARERLVLVQAGERQLLLGVAPGRVNLIEKYEQPLIESGAAAGDFAAKLQQALSNKGAK